jgi:hypothetical protein
MASKVTKQKHEEMNVRMNVNIPKSFHKRVKQQALDEDITITKLVLKALRGYLGDEAFLELDSFTGPIH